MNSITCLINYFFYKLGISLRNKKNNDENYSNQDYSLDSYYPTLDDEGSPFVIGWSNTELSKLEKTVSLRDSIDLAESKLREKSTHGYVQLIVSLFLYKV